MSVGACFAVLLRLVISINIKFILYPRGMYGPLSRNKQNPRMRVSRRRRHVPFCLSDEPIGSAVNVQGEKKRRGRRRAADTRAACDRSTLNNNCSCARADTIESRLIQPAKLCFCARGMCANKQHHHRHHHATQMPLTSTVRAYRAWDEPKTKIVGRVCDGDFFFEFSQPNLAFFRDR